MPIAIPMIYIKKRTSDDLARLIIKLMKYKKYLLTREEANDYVDKIKFEVML
jgi:hypothetical protein